MKAYQEKLAVIRWNTDYPAWAAYDLVTGELIAWDTDRYRLESVV